MGIVKVIQNTNSNGNYLFNALEYIKRKAVDYSGYRVDPDDAYNQMMAVKRYFGKTSCNQLMHIVIVFNENEVDIDRCMDYGYRIAQYFGDRFQTCYALHQDTKFHDKKRGYINSNYHLHMILNSVSYVDGKMFAENRGSIGKFKEYVSEVTKDRYMQILYSKCGE